MARNDGVDRISARNVNLSSGKIGNTQRHNEREKESYTNPDIVPERSNFNIHFKTPADDYEKMFAQMEADKVISTRGLKEDANLYGELIFDVNSAYFHNHGGYEFAKQFYEDAYKAAVEIVGGEQYILSAVMHADERNRAMSEALKKDVYHYHMHVAYIPVVEKKILWSKRCKDPSLVGTVKETVMQVSSSKKWISKPALDEGGNPILQKNGKPVLRKSYSVLQDDFFRFMRAAGYDDVERGERGSSEEHLTVTQFKVEQEQHRLEELNAAKTETQAEILHLQEEKIDTQNEAKEAKARLDDLAPKLNKMEMLAAQYSNDPEKILPEAGALECARAYREKKVKPLLAGIVKVLRSVYHAYLDLVSKFERLQSSYNREVSKNNTLSDRLEDVVSENRVLRNAAENYERVSRAYGPERVAATVEAIKRQEQTEKEQKRVARQQHDRVSR
ncbi:plasmid recombination protein [Oscillibacter sp.]|uniref:plasmid recombination protein n=1 Tax=Oscillibacter sp. TaxID=1945593 RepID=UPI00339814D2